MSDSFSEPLETLDVDLSPEPQNSVIWLHGLGADASDFLPIISAFDFEPEQAPRFVFPKAPIRPVTVHQGMEMPAWYDVLGFGEAFEQDAEGIWQSMAALNKIIDHEIARGIPAENIMLVGFSQGGAMALITGLCCAKTLAGMLIISSYLPIADQGQPHFHLANQKTPIEFHHGLSDEVVFPKWGKISKEILEGLNYQTTWREYSAAHEITSKQIVDIKQWIERCMKF